MYSETTFMQYGKGLGGLIGLTLKSKVTIKQVYGLKTCIGIVEDLEKTRQNIPEKHKKQTVMVSAVYRSWKT